MEFEPTGLISLVIALPPIRHRSDQKGRQGMRSHAPGRAFARLLVAPPRPPELIPPDIATPEKTHVSPFIAESEQSLVRRGVGR